MQPSNSHASQDPASREALQNLLADEREALARWLGAIVRDADLADDALQEAWLQVSRGGWRFVAHVDAPIPAARAWLRQVAFRAALRLARNQRIHQRHVHQWHDRQPTAEMRSQLLDLERNEQVAVMLAQLRCLSPAQRRVIELHFMEGMPFAEVGRRVGCSTVGARVRAWRGLAILRRRMAPIGLLVLPGTIRGELRAAGPSGIPLPPAQAWSAIWPMSTLVACVLVAACAIWLGAEFDGTVVSGSRPPADTTGLAGAVRATHEEVREPFQASTADDFYRLDHPALEAKQARSKSFLSVPASGAGQTGLSSTRLFLHLLTRRAAKNLPPGAENGVVVLQDSTLADLIAGGLVTSDSPREELHADGSHSHRRQYAYIAGYDELDHSPDPVISTMDYGISAFGRFTEAPDGLFAEGLSCRSICPLQIVARTARVHRYMPEGGAYHDFGLNNYPFEESTFRFSRGDQGTGCRTFIPDGASICVPMTSTVETWNPHGSFTHSWPVPLDPAHDAYLMGGWPLNKESSEPEEPAWVVITPRRDGEPDLPRSVN